jgi:hypothetical protein
VGEEAFLIDAVNAYDLNQPRTDNAIEFRWWGLAAISMPVAPLSGGKRGMSEMSFSTFRRGAEAVAAFWDNSPSRTCALRGGRHFGPSRPRLSIEFLRER